MTDEALTLTLPAPLAQELRAATQDFLVDLLARGLREVKVEHALERYARGGMSFGAAAQLAGVAQGDFARYAYARGLEPPISEETLARRKANQDDVFVGYRSTTPGGFLRYH